MTTKNGRSKLTQQERERARLYQARQEFVLSRNRRRTRDNLLAGIIGGLLIALAVTSQFVYYGAGPGAESPEPASTPSPSVSETPLSGTDTTDPLAPSPSTAE